MQAANGFRRIVAAAILVLTIVPVAAAKYGGGSGTPDDPYQIWTPEQMDAIGADPNNWDKNFKLMADIDLSAYSGSSFHMIGSRWGTPVNRPFNGAFDGDGHTITGFSYSTGEQGPIGLFIYVSPDYIRGGKAEVRNLRLAGAKIDAPKGVRVGALVGSGYGSIINCSVTDVTVAGYNTTGGLTGESGGTIRNCSCTGQVTSSGWAGGLVGSAEGGTITDCLFDGTVTGNRCTGGLVGYNKAQIASCGTTGSVTGTYAVGGLVGANSPGKASITTCWSTASVKGTDDYTGGLIGENYDSEIKSCWASGDVQGSRYVGGFAGATWGTVSHCWASGAVHGSTLVGGFAGSISNSTSFCYSTGRVSGDESVGGFAPSGSPYLCYWDTQTSGTSQGAGRGRTTAQMMSAATFAGWGYESLWVIEDGADYPHLIWENTGGRLLVGLPRTYGGGTGEPNDPYLIDTVEQFMAIAYYREDAGKHFLLTRDLDFNGVDTREFISLTISGSFDGDGHRILNFSYTAEGCATVGLFGSVASGTVLRDLHMVNAQVGGARDVGALVGNNSGRIQNCSVTGDVEGQYNTGGLVGYNTGLVEACTAEVQVTGETSTGALAGRNAGYIKACGAKGQVTGQSSVGGVAGWNDREISSSWSAADVTGQTEVGGLVGTAGEARRWMACPAPPPSFVPSLSDSRITACYSTGQVTGQQSLGGLVGKNAGVVRGCYAASPILIAPNDVGSPAAPSTDIGGLVGKNDYGVIHLSYWDVERSGLLQSTGGRGKTTVQMTDPETFRGWSQLGVWFIDPGLTYPYFESAGASGEPLVDDPNRYGGGTGAIADPYQIWTPQQWFSLGYYPSDRDKHFVLMSNLDLSGVDPNAVWPIGIPTAPFAGTFDGAGHSIANFTLRHDTELYIGMFGCLGVAQLIPYTEPAKISNLHLRDVDTCGSYHVGGLAAYSDKCAIISACSVTGRVTATGKNAGGLVGYSLGTLEGCSGNCQMMAYEVVGELAGFSGGPVTSCSGAGVVKTVGERDSYAGGLIGENCGKVQLCDFTGSIVAAYTAGGLVALNQNEIFRCSAHATITGTYLLGGLVGYNEYYANIRESFADGALTGGNSVGGLVGHNRGKIANCLAMGQVQGDDRVGGLMGDGYREIKFCYSTCRVSGRTLVGGFAGELEKWGPLTVASCFWDVEASTRSDGVAGMDPDPNGVTGLPTASMKIAAPFLAAGWDFIDETTNGTADIWQISEGQDYPRLAWKGTPQPAEPVHNR